MTAARAPAADAVTVVASDGGWGAVGAGHRDNSACVSDHNRVVVGGVLDCNGYSGDHGTVEVGDVGGGGIEHLGVEGGSRSGRHKSGIRSSRERARTCLAAGLTLGFSARRCLCPRERASAVSAQAPLVASSPPAAPPASRPGQNCQPATCAEFDPQEVGAAFQRRTRHFLGPS